MNHQLWKMSLLALCVGVVSACEIEGTEPTGDEPRFVPPAPPAPFVPEPPEPQTRRINILHTNDEHSHLFGFAPESSYPFTPEADGTVDPASVLAKISEGKATQGGFARRQFLVNQIREESEDPVLLLSGGDVMMGTIFQLASTTAAPDYTSMALLGYDAVTFGNHEFDYGPGGLAQTILAAERLTFGGLMPILATNINFDAVGDNPGGQALEALYGEPGSGAPIVPYLVKTLANGLVVGMVGLVGYDAALVAPGKTPILFSFPKGGPSCAEAACENPVAQCLLDVCVNPLDAAGHFAALAADVQPVINTLRNDIGVDVVIALTHLGSYEDQILAQNTTGIDVIVGGHSHEVIEPTVIASNTSGQTIIVQAGSYGRRLGQLVVTVAPDGTVGYDAAESMLHNIDQTLDAGIVEGSALPSTVSPALNTALTYTQGILGPVLAGLNASFAGAFGAGFNWLDPVLASDYNIEGEEVFQDTNLLHLSTDASRAIVGGGLCRSDELGLIVVQANGVLRESLIFDLPAGGGQGTTTYSDLYRVDPLGASPFDDGGAPGFPLVFLYLAGGSLYAGLEVGVTQGLLSDSFFLSSAGIQVTYDRERAPFDPEDPNNTGRITKLVLGTTTAEFEDADNVVFDLSAGSTFLERWQNGFTPASLFPVVSNLYLAGFLEAFGITPLDATGAPLVSEPLGLGNLVLCRNPAPEACVDGDSLGAVGYCTDIGAFDPADGRWELGGVALPELKEWQALFQYVSLFPPNGDDIPTVPADVYETNPPPDLRVVPVE